MKLRSKVVACVATAAMLASGTAMAAVNSNSIHLALTSLRVAFAKMGVANAMLSAATPPSSNAQAHIAPADKLTTHEISAVLVSQGGVINVYLTPAVGMTGGILQLVPRIVAGEKGKKAVRYTCYSSNIPDIATAAPECSYHPDAK